MGIRFSQVIIVIAVMCLLALSGAAQRDKSVVTPAEIARYMHPPIPHIAEAPVWEPTKNEIVEMEGSFDKLATLKPERECCRRIDFVFRPNDYYMQYAPIYFEGREYIYINAFRELRNNWKDYWRKGSIMAKGGGKNFWQALYDPKTKVFSRPIFNSEE